MNDFRISTSKSEIGRILDKIMQKGGRILLWQNQGKERVLSDAVLNKVDLKQGNLSFRPTNQQVFNFEKDFKVYFHGKEQSMVFKSPSSILNDKLLLVPFPTEVRLVEKRGHTRIDLKNKLANQIQILRSHAFKENPDEYSFLVLDLSRQGCAFRMFAHDLTYFTVGQNIQVKSVAKVKLSDPLGGVIKYIRAFRSKKQIGASRVFRVGVVFDSDLNEEALEEIKSAL